MDLAPLWFSWADSAAVYTCQKPNGDENRCNFFLWDTDAHSRELNALSMNSRTEPTASANITPNKPTPARSTPAWPTPSEAQRFKSPPPPYTVEAAPAEQSARKRGRSLVDEDDDEFGINEDDSAFDDPAVRAAVETPQKAARTDSHLTPRRRLPWDSTGNGLMTPKSQRGEFIEPFASRISNAASPPKTQQSSTSSVTVTASTPFDTPTPVRFREATTPSAHANETLVDDVFNVLSSEGLQLNAKVSAALKTVLLKHSRRAEGNNKAKEILRLRIKAEEAKNKELSLRNNTLQAELEVAKATVDHLQWENENGSDG